MLRLEQVEDFFDGHGVVDGNFGIADDLGAGLVEASRRIGSKWLVELELRTFSGQPPSDPLAALRTDDHFQLSIQRHF